MKNTDLDKLKKLAEDIKKIANIVNDLIDKEDFNSLKKYENDVIDCFDLLNEWMAEYEL